MSTKRDPGSALTEAFLAGKAALTRYVATFFVRREDVEDTVQEAYLQALISESEKDIEIQSPGAYLFRVARNIALNRKNRQKKLFIESVGTIDDSLALDDGSNLCEQLYGQQKLRALGVAIQGLPPQCRKVFLMQRMDGLSYKEIGARLGISTRTVEKHLEKALKRCAEHMASGGFAGDEVEPVANLDDYRNRRAL